MDQDSDAPADSPEQMNLSNGPEPDGQESDSQEPPTTSTTPTGQTAQATDAGDGAQSAQAEHDRDGEVASASMGPVARWALHRRLYNWVLSFAHRKHSGLALFVLSFVESSFFPVPPDVLLAPLCLGNRKKSMMFATICTVASVLGAFLGYAIGYGALKAAQDFIPGIDQSAIEGLQSEFETRGQLYVFIAALTPIPFKLLTITAGAAKMNFLLFTAACVVGRGVRFFAVAALFWWIGPKATPLIDKYFNWLCLIFIILLVGGFAALKFLR